MWYLLRHGKTVENESHLIQGRLDTPLSDFGREQARRLAANYPFKSMPEIIYTSPLIRAKETAEIFAATFKSPVIVEVDLIEWSCGEAEGHSLEHYLQLHPGFEIRWDDMDFRYPNGESKRELAGRAKRFVERLWSDTRVPLVVGHQAILNYVIISALGLPMTAAMSFRLGNCGFAKLNPGKPYGRLVLFQGDRNMRWEPPKP